MDNRLDNRFSLFFSVIVSLVITCSVRVTFFMVPPEINDYEMLDN